MAYILFEKSKKSTKRTSGELLGKKNSDIWWMLRFIIVLLISLSANGLTGQNRTVGWMLNDSMSFNGYTLFAPNSSGSTYLIDNCGYKINEWTSDHMAGMLAYLLPDGSIMRAGRVFASFSAGGSGGIIEHFSWDNDLLWSYKIADDNQHQHHDIAPLPNGNVLIIAWDRKTAAEAIEAGRDPSSIGNNGVWYEKILELKPIGSDSAEIVWEWYLYDHLIQERDSTKSNFGVVKDHPEKIDVNYRIFMGPNPGSPDWFHMNAIDYNPELDQIIFSSRTLNEIYIIDHSTTTAEAATGIGGLAGKGGDILYRWGNPQVYQRGTAADQKLFGQHDSQWIDEGEHQGKVLIFNNGTGRPGGSYSSLERIIPPRIDLNYALEDSLAFGPEDTDWTFQGNGPTAFYSNRVSGAQALENGNTLICSGNQYRFFEIDPNDNLVWDYINPVNQFGPLTQGTTSASRDVFRAFRYSPSYSAFDNKDLTPLEPIELNPGIYDCQIILNSTSAYEVKLSSVNIFPNPAQEFITVDGLDISMKHLIVFNQIGQVEYVVNVDQPFLQIDVSEFQSGMYILRVGNITKKFIIQR